MNRVTLCTALLSVFSCLALAIPQAYAHEAWRISEIFSSSDGELQYITLFSEAADQNQLDGTTLSTRNTSGELHNSYTHTSNLEGSTAQATLLISTQALADLAGISPDFTIPAGFLPTEGGSVDFADVDTLTYEAQQLPKNGTQALRADFSIVEAMAVNFAGETAAVESAVMSRFDDDTLLLHLPVVDVPGMDTVNASLLLIENDPIELRLHSAYEYVPEVTAGAGAAVLTGNVLYVPQALVGGEIFEANMTMLGDDPIIFGNLEVLSITIPTPPEPDPPEPDPPQPDPLEASINAGEQTFVSVCSTCHGPSGAGGASAENAPSLIASSLRTMELLQPFIQDNMPFGDPEQCVDSATSSCATDVSNFIMHRIQDGTQNPPPDIYIDPEGVY